MTIKLKVPFTHKVLRISLGNPEPEPAPFLLWRDQIVRVTEYGLVTIEFKWDPDNIQHAIHYL